MAAQLTRSDARDNRARILDAARAVFTVDGFDAPMRAVARRAGLGPATLYRHFPTKRELVTEAFAARMQACRTIVDASAAIPDPWVGFTRVVEEICVLRARDRGLTAAFLAAYPHARDFAADREHALRGIAEIARRAKEQGMLREDFVIDDLVLVIMANDGIRAATPDARVAASRRFAALAIQGFRAVAGRKPVLSD